MSLLNIPDLTHPLSEAYARYGLDSILLLSSRLSHYFLPLLIYFDLGRHCLFDPGPHDRLGSS